MMCMGRGWSEMHAGGESITFKLNHTAFFLWSWICVVDWYCVVGVVWSVIHTYLENAKRK